jgi:hypothetical protein
MTLASLDMPPARLVWTAPIKLVPEWREDFTGAFPKWREPKLAYMHVANDDSHQLPLLAMTKGDKAGIIVAVVSGLAAVGMAILGVVSL